ncbi:hypothetical protein [Sinorhizobium meliloti]|uniref:hypothetical protein n=1 Tax=Rhizobium meliloti TaxID=382 RepID=UPI0013E3A422|nr:hypothetical protein [Sinorhizobium meliloti]
MAVNTVDEIKETIAKSLTKYSLAMSHGTGEEQADALEELAETLAKLIAANSEAK